MAKCKGKPEVYSRIVGYFRPVQAWNLGKEAEYLRRKEFNIDKVQKFVGNTGEKYFSDEGIEQKTEVMSGDF